MSDVVVEGDQCLVRFVQLDEMSEIGTRVAHHETLTTHGGGVERDVPSDVRAMRDRSLEVRHEVSDVMHTSHRAESSGLMFDHEFDHEISELAVGARVLEPFGVDTRATAREFDVMDGDERTDSPRRAPRLQGRLVQIAYRIGDLTRVRQWIRHDDSLSRGGGSRVWS